MYSKCTVSIEVQSRRDADKSGSSPNSFVTTLPRLRIQEGASLLYSFTYKMVCGGLLRGGEEAPLYSGGGGVGATLRGPLQGKLHLDLN